MGAAGTVDVLCARCRRIRRVRRARAWVTPPQAVDKKKMQNQWEIRVPRRNEDDVEGVDRGTSVLARTEAAEFDPANPARNRGA